MNNRYTGNNEGCQCEVKPNLSLKVDITSESGASMKELDFALRFFVYGNPEDVNMHKSQLYQHEGKYYALLNEESFAKGWLFCDVIIAEYASGNPNVSYVTVRCNTGCLVNDCCREAENLTTSGQGYVVKFSKEEVYPYPGYTPEYLTSEELWTSYFRLPELTADRAIADEQGNRITDTYVRREAVANHIKQIYNQQFLDNPPLITEGYITPEMLSEDTRTLLENTGQTINNLPDGEDLQSVHGVLKLADKQYNPNAYSGLGRRILRKNIVAGVNVLTQSMMQWPNTIYVIQYDYDLQGETITVPENCVLQFEGGMLSNGVLMGANTAINDTLTKIFGLDIELNGTWNISAIYPEWFGAKGDSITNDTDVLNHAINLCSKTKIKLFITKEYAFTNLHISSSVVIEGNGQTLKHIGEGVALLIKPIDSKGIDDWVRTKISNFSVELNKNSKVGVEISECIASKFDNIVVKGVSSISSNMEDYPTETIGFYMNGDSSIISNGNSIWNNDFYRCAANDVNIGYKCKGIFSDTHFENISCSRANVCMDLESTTSWNVVINNSVFVESLCGILIRGVFVNFLIQGCNIENYKLIGFSVHGSGRYSNVNVISNSIITVHDSPYDISLNCAYSIIVGNTISYSNMKIDGSPISCMFSQNRTFNDNNVVYPDNFLERNPILGYRHQNNTDCVGFLNKLVGIEDLLVNNIKLHNSNRESVDIAYESPTFIKFTDKGGVSMYLPSAIKEEKLETLAVNNVGTSMFVTNYNKPAWKSSDWKTWVYADGNKIGTKYTGSSLDRPSGINVGFLYFDYSINKPIWWTGTKWVDATGAEV